ncbi:serine hydrolase [Rhodoblastus sp.]|uniref:serine hydrolase n=1 Tax=Rhodoblastus sp. TaxID=1962975 RepID=UPI003F9555D8
MFKCSFRVGVSTRMLVSALVLAIAGAGFSTPAQARRHHHHHHGRHAHAARHIRFVARHGRHHGGTAAVSTNAAIVVDGATGRELFGVDENALRHPASITKVMTLYLLFEQMEKGRIHLSDEIPVSDHAAAQAPSKLGLRAGSSILVEDAIKSIVTKSANDMAVAVAEYVGGSEGRFAEEMTAKAHALGMANTHYANASGLPNPEQLTTAHDLAVLGRAIQSRFPQYFHYFSLREAYVRGMRLHNHDHLLGRIAGVDGIKTGYTNASGYNLLTSAKHDGHYIVAVVMGGRTWRSRDAYMESLIAKYIHEGGSPRGAAQVAERDRSAAQAAERDRSAAQAAERDKSAAQAAERDEPARDEPVAQAAPPAEHSARPAFVSASAENSRDNAGNPDESSIPTASIPRRHGEAHGATTAAATGAATPASHWMVGPSGVSALRAATRFHADGGAQAAARESDQGSQRKDEARQKPRRLAKAESQSDDDAPAPRALPQKPPAPGWMIQIGATDDVGKAAELLDKAKARRGALLASAKPFTEKVQKGHGTIYRARFAGLEESKAEAACKALKHSGFSCFAIKD